MDRKYWKIETLGLFLFVVGILCFSVIVNEMSTYACSFVPSYDEILSYKPELRLFDLGGKFLVFWGSFILCFGVYLYYLDEVRKK